MTDYISRADAIEEISKGVWNVHELIDRIKALPSADAEQVTSKLKSVEISTDKGDESTMSQPNGKLESADAEQGEWKFVDHEVFAGEYFCSICGKRAEVDLYGEWILSNYCPNCGARMKGGAE